MKWLIDLALGLFSAWLGKKTNDAKDAGRSEARAEVAAEAVKTVDEARKDKEKADAQVRDTDYSTRVDRL